MEDPPPLPEKNIVEFCQLIEKYGYLVKHYEKVSVAQN